MKILFLAGELGIGGIETYIVRICEQLFADGNEVSVWIVKNSADAGLLNQLKLSKVDVKILSRFHSLGAFLHKTNFPKNELREFDLVVSTGSTPLLVAFKIFNKSKDPVRIVQGIFSQFEHVHSVNLYRNRIISSLFLYLCPQNVFFCTSGCKEAHENFFSINLHDSKILPLLINLNKFNTTEIQEILNKKNSESHTQKIKVLSVGRFVDFKKYNSYMPFVVKNLRNRGIDIEWHVYGYGILKQKMQQTIASLGLHEFVFIHEKIEYDLLPSLFTQFDIFLGSGTTLIEASASGLPAIAAIDELSEPLSPGFIFDRIGDYTSDISPDMKLFPVEEILYDYYNLDSLGRQNLRKNALEYSKRFNIENATSDYNQVFETSKKIVPGLPFFFNLFDFFDLFWQVLIALILRRQMPWLTKPR